jgi:CRISPR type III-B/RAMP module-associated protein Cmr5
MIHLMEQKRAADAWAAICAIRDTKDQQIEGRFRSMVRSAPAMIQRNGLGQFFAFVASKGFDNTQLAASGADRADGLLYQHLGRWLLISMRIATNAPNQANVKPGAGPQSDPLNWLLQESTTLDPTMQATNEALAWLQWARRFAESQLRKTNEGKE